MYSKGGLMPGILKDGFRFVVKKGTLIVKETIMGYALKDGVPILKMLIENKVLIPALLIVSLGAGVWYDKISGDVAAVIAGVGCIAFYAIRELVKKKG